MKTETVRPYTWADIKRLQGRTKVKHTLAELGALRLRSLMNQGYVRALGAQTGNQAVQMVKAGLKAVYCSGWQTAADANTSGHTYPDQSLYPVDSVPALVKRINNALLRAEQIDVLEEDGNLNRPYLHWMAPIIADAEAGFGGNLNAFELMKSMIEAGAAGVHFEDQLASEKKCGHLGGKVLVPTSAFIRTLVAARLAADVCEVPTVIIARTDALGAQLITSDVDTQDLRFMGSGTHRTPEGFWPLWGDPMERTIARGLAYAPYADMLWFETSNPDVDQAKLFADAIHAQFPDKLLAYNCSPSFNWKKKLTDDQIAQFQDVLGQMGYIFQFITLAGFHSLSHGMFTLAKAYNETGMTAYSSLQEVEFSSEQFGYTATKHQREVGTSYFDAIAQVISNGKSSTLAMAGSTETEQFSGHEVGSGHGEEEGHRQPAQPEATPDVGSEGDTAGVAPAT
jgi:isocitrate lyase